jgi:hypothetical protein
LAEGSDAEIEGMLDLAEKIVVDAFEVETGLTLEEFEESWREFFLHPLFI